MRNTAIIALLAALPLAAACSARSAGAGPAAATPQPPARAEEPPAAAEDDPASPRFVPVPEAEMPSEPAVEERTAYMVGVGDVLEISVYGDPEMTRQVPVRPDGMISYTFVGDVPASGRGIQEIRDDLQVKLGNYLRTPEVTVIVTEFGKQKVYIGGEISQPGIFHISPRDNTLLDVVYMAGLPTGQADVEKAVLVRDGRMVEVDFKGLLRGDLSGNVTLRDNDLIYIPEAAERYIYVLGEVRSPKALETTIPLSITNVLAQSGGMNQSYAKTKEIAVLRGGLKEPMVAVVNYKRLIEGDFSQNIQVKPGDIVFVPTTGLGKYSRVVEQILRTFTLLFQGRLVSEGFQ